MHALLLNLFLEAVRFRTKKVMSQTLALSSTKDVPFSKSKNSVQVSEDNIFYSSTTSSWKHLIFLWTLNASIHNRSLVVLTWLKPCSFLIYQCHCFWLKSPYAQAGFRWQIENCSARERKISSFPIQQICDKALLTGPSVDPGQGALRPSCWNLVTPSVQSTPCELLAGMYNSL